MLLASSRPDTGHPRQQRCRSRIGIDADGVDAVSTTASSERASLVSPRSCWYCPTPIAFGSILTSSASGSCSRRAMRCATHGDDSRSGNSSRRNGRGRVDRAPASRTGRLRTSFRPRQQLSTSLHKLVRLAAEAVPLPIATDRRMRELLAELAQRLPAPRPTRLGALHQVDRRGRQHLARASTTTHLDAGAIARDRAPDHRGSRTAPPAAGRAGWRRTPPRGAVAAAI